jgi:hypothetical protein
MGLTSYEDDIEESTVSEHFGDVIAEARSIGINPTQIIQEIQSTIKINPQRVDSVYADENASSRKRLFIEKIQQIMEKYRLHSSSIEIGTDLDSYVMDGYTNVRVMLSSSRVEERYHDGRSNPIDLHGYSTGLLHDSKRILFNLLKELVEVTKKNRAKVEEIESAVDYVSNLCLDKVKDCSSTSTKGSVTKRRGVKSQHRGGGR